MMMLKLAMPAIAAILKRCAARELAHAAIDVNMPTQIASSALEHPTTPRIAFERPHIDRDDLVLGREFHLRFE